MVCSMRECPRIRCRVMIFPPLIMKWVAKLCRKAWVACPEGKSGFTSFRTCLKSMYDAFGKSRPFLLPRITPPGSPFLNWTQTSAFYPPDPDQHKQQSYLSQSSPASFYRGLVCIPRSSKEIQSAVYLHALRIRYQIWSTYWLESKASTIKSHDFGTIFVTSKHMPLIT